MSLGAARRTLESINQSSLKEPEALPAYAVDCVAGKISWRRVDCGPGVSAQEMLRLKLPAPVTSALHDTAGNASEDSLINELEQRLQTVSRHGELSSARFFLGVDKDPFFPFDERFHPSLRFLRIFERYVPGMLHIQTRSPLVVLALPTLKALRTHAVVTIAIETFREYACAHYTPTLPRVRERLKAANTLRKFGIEVCLQVSPLLPYGERSRDAMLFAEVLAAHADSILISPLHRMNTGERVTSGESLVAQILAQEGKHEWLRHDAHHPLRDAIRRIAPEKLEQKVRHHLREKQVSLF